MAVHCVSGGGRGGDARRLGSGSRRARVLTGRPVETLVGDRHHGRALRVVDDRDRFDLDQAPWVGQPLHPH